LNHKIANTESKIAVQHSRNYSKAFLKYEETIKEILADMFSRWHCSSTRIEHSNMFN
jgi:hypothetical protein